MIRFPFSDLALFALMLAVARWGDALPIPLLSVAQWALGLEVMGSLVVWIIATAVVRRSGTRGLLVALGLGLFGLGLLAFFGVVIGFELGLLVLLPFVAMLLGPFVIALWRDDMEAIRFLRTRALVVLGVVLAIALDGTALDLQIEFPMSRETRVALGYHPNDPRPLHTNVSMGLVFYGVLSVVELLRLAWWRLTRNWD
jgi:hypothetical protein